MKKADIFIGYPLVVLGLGMVIFAGWLLRDTISKVDAAKNRPIPAMTILEAEEKLGVEILVPTVRELQEHCLRHGGSLPVHGVDGRMSSGGETLTEMDRVRCMQNGVKDYNKASLITEINDFNNLEW